MSSSKLEKLREIKKRINIEVQGRDYCDTGKVNLFIANHNCLKDIFYLPMALDDEITSLISARLIYKNVDERKQIVNECLYALPIEAHGGKRYSDMCLQYGSKMMESGIDVSIFPEGAYIKDDVIHKGRTGAARMLFDAVKEKTAVNLIPVAIEVNKENVDLDSYCFDGDNVVVNFLKPIDYMEDFEKFMSSTDMETKNQCLHHVIDTSFQSIASALGKTYDDSYIELFPKKNVIYANGNILPTDIAQNPYYLDLYDYQLKIASENIIKQLKKK